MGKIISTNVVNKYRVKVSDLSHVSDVMFDEGFIFGVTVSSTEHGVGWWETPDLEEAREVAKFVGEAIARLATTTVTTESFIEVGEAVEQ